MARSWTYPAAGAPVAAPAAPRGRPTVIVGGAALVVILSIARQNAGATGLALSSAGLATIGQVLAPAVLLSLFIERATEVVMQWLWLSRLDVALTGLLLAGGADGIHKIVTTFTAFLDSTRNRVAVPADAQPAPQPAAQPAAPVQQHPAASPRSAPAPAALLPVDDPDDGV